MITKVKLTNAFWNAGGKGMLVTAVVVEGNTEAGDNLLIPGGIKEPILEVGCIPFDGDERQHVTLTVQRDGETKWFQFYGKEIEIEKTVPTTKPKSD